MTYCHCRATAWHMIGNPSDPSHLKLGPWTRSSLCTICCFAHLLSLSQQLSTNLVLRQTVCQLGKLGSKPLHFGLIVITLAKHNEGSFEQEDTNVNHFRLADLQHLHQTARVLEDAAHFVQPCIAFLQSLCIAEPSTAQAQWQDGTGRVDAVIISSDH